ncbi:trimethylamine methyltransferase family protein [Methanomassiliicoccales archaeon LGM-RCC1]|nr:trimethylamine methyltransferase family protein [Methanomassiliicoccales archaeon LGM-RCC1]
MKLEVLTKQECAQIHEGALKVLEKTGGKFMDPRIFELCKKNGCDVDEKTGIIKFPRGLIEDCLKKVPNSFEISGRSKKPIKVGVDMQSRFANFGTAVKIGRIDDNGNYTSRASNIDDVYMMSKLTDAIECYDMSVTPCSANELISAGVSKDAHEQLQAIQGFTGHFMADWVAKNIKYGFEFTKILRGSEEEAYKKPLYTIGCPSASPLTFDDRFSGNIIESTKYNMPTMAMGMALNGATCPISLGGGLVVPIAESLATVAISQMLNPGNAVWFGSSGTMMDLKNGGPSCGAPERALISAAYANMAAYYNMPSFIAGPETDSKRIDYQAGHEKTITGYTATLAKASMHFGPGMLEGGLSTSPEMLMLDSDNIEMMKYADNGILVNDEELALEDIYNVGPGGDFLSLPMTLARMDTQSNPAIFNRQDEGTWMESFGGKDSLRIAHDKVQDLIDNYTPEPIDRDLLDELKKVVDKADEAARNSTSVY